MPFSMRGVDMIALNKGPNWLATADEEGLRLIIPFIDHWSWWGGRAVF